jgi:heme-degrading monooxygenase HmoA
MFIRLTYLSLLPHRKEDVEKIYIDQVIPVVQKQAGNTGIRLLEPTNEDDQYISLTEWDTEDDAQRYEASGTYRTLVDLLKESYATKPVLKTYNVVESKMPVTS